MPDLLYWLHNFDESNKYALTGVWLRDNVKESIQLKELAGWFWWWALYTLKHSNNKIGN